TRGRDGLPVRPPRALVQAPIRESHRRHAARVRAQLAAGGSEACAREGRRADRVAHAVGYEDASFISRLFRREVGLTPAQYRKRFGALRLALDAPRAAAPDLIVSDLDSLSSAMPKQHE